jgi:alginate O-acetyltransferase complex protein AlgI
VYLKLGGNQAYIRNIVIIFVTIGLWHGAGLNFIVWGAYHALLVVLYHVTQKAWDRMIPFVQVGLTFTLVSLGWPLFFLSLPDYALLLGDLAAMDFSGLNTYGTPFLVYIAICSLIVFFFDEDVWLYGEESGFFDRPVILAGLFVSSMFLFDIARTFVYFRF